MRGEATSININRYSDGYGYGDGYGNGNGDGW